MPVIGYHMDPKGISEKYSEYIPNSAKHRLFIWHFVAGKIMENPVLGHGFGSSKLVKIENNQMIKYDKYLWSPLPMHPHNNILQILFETGLIGLVLFLSLVYKYLKQIDNITIKSKNYKSISYACFINYYIIGMISFSIWQLWWVCTGILAVTLMRSLVKTID